MDWNGPPATRGSIESSSWTGLPTYDETFVQVPLGRCPACLNPGVSTMTARFSYRIQAHGQKIWKRGRWFADHLPNTLPFHPQTDYGSAVGSDHCISCRLQLSSMPASPFWRGCSPLRVERHPVQSALPPPSPLSRLALSPLSASRRPGYPSYPSPVAPLRCAVLSTLNDRLTSTNNSTGRLALPTCVIAVLVRQQTIIHHHSRDPRHIIQLAIAIHPSRPTLQVLQISTVMR